MSGGLPPHLPLNRVVDMWVWPAMTAMTPVCVAPLQIDWPTADQERDLCVSVFTSEDAVSESC